MALARLLRCCVLCAAAQAFNGGAEAGGAGAAGAPVKMDWQYSLGPRRVAVPGYWEEGDMVFALGRDPKSSGSSTLLAALNAVDGQERWRRTFDEPTEVDTTAHWKPVVYPQSQGCLVYIVANETLYAIDHLGEYRWNFTIPFTGPAMRMTTPKIGPDDVLFLAATALGGSENDTNSTVVMALEPTTGTQIWSKLISGAAKYPPVFLRLGEYDGAVAIALQDTGGIIALSSMDGHRLWEVGVMTNGRHEAEPTVGYCSSASAFRLFLVTTVTQDEPQDAPAGDTPLEETYVTSLDEDGTIVWQRAVPIGGSTYVSSFVPGADGRVGYLTQFGNARAHDNAAHHPRWGGDNRLSKDGLMSAIMALNLSNGDMAWSVYDQHNLAMLSDPVLNQKGNTLYTAAIDGGEVSYVYCVDLIASHSIQSVPVVVASPENPRYLSTPPAPLLVLDPSGYAVVPGIDGRLYAMNLPTSSETPAPPVPAKTSTFNMGLLIGLLGGAVGLILFILPFFLKSSNGGGSSDFDLEPLKRAARRGKSSAPIDPQGSAGLLYNSNAKYVALRLLGSGAFGTVYKVKCQTDGNLYAMKRIPCDSEAQRLTAVKEWKLLHQVNHPNLITAHETFVNWSEENRPEKEVNHAVRRYVCIVLDYLAEGDLHQYINRFRKGAKMEENTILSFGAQISSLLAVLHGLSPPIIHRDLKPENVLLADNYSRIVVTDFGLARFVNTEAYLSSQVGTLAYIAPETWDRHYGPGVDVWALGCIMYVAATRRIRTDNVRILWREANHPQFHTSIRDELLYWGYSETLARITTKCLTPDRRRRPTSVQVDAWFADVLAGGDGADVTLTPSQTDPLSPIVVSNESDNTHVTDVCFPVLSDEYYIDVDGSRAFGEKSSRMPTTASEDFYEEPGLSKGSTNN